MAPNFLGKIPAIECGEHHIIKTIRTKGKVTYHICVYIGI